MCLITDNLIFVLINFLQLPHLYHSLYHSFFFSSSPQNIFQGKDIREQLPQECKEFEEISVSWKIIMSRLNEDNNALRGTHHPGISKKLILLLRA